MKNLCGDYTFHGCPASFYTSCRAYKEGLNCWEIEDKPCCRNSNFSICSNCKVYNKCQAVISSTNIDAIS